jgi:tripartite-type tricarboxylate transporter receptor subunit TctC
MGCVLSAFLIPSSLASAENYPAKPIRIITPVTAGTAGDLRVRLLAEKLSARLGQRFVVENKPGAGTTLGNAHAAAAKPDGYTILATFTPSFTIGPLIYKDVGYDPEKSFVPIAIFARASPIFVVHPDVPAKTIKEFIALARSKPGEVTVAHSGFGGGAILPTELFRQAATLDLLYVPYKGESLATPDLLGGQVSAMFVYTASGVPLIKARKLRALAVAGAARNGALPGVPTFVEEGYPDVQFYVHGVFLGPVGLSKDIATLLSREIAAILKDPEVIASYESTGGEPVYGSPEQVRELLRRELKVSRQLVEKLGAVPE